MTTQPRKHAFFNLINKKHSFSLVYSNFQWDFSDIHSILCLSRSLKSDWCSEGVADSLGGSNATKSCFFMHLGVPGVYGLGILFDALVLKWSFKHWWHDHGDLGLVFLTIIFPFTSSTHGWYYHITIKWINPQQGPRVNLASQEKRNGRRIKENRER